MFVDLEGELINPLRIKRSIVGTKLEIYVFMSFKLIISVSL